MSIFQFLSSYFWGDYIYLVCFISTYVIKSKIYFYYFCFRQSVFFKEIKIGKTLLYLFAYLPFACSSLLGNLNFHLQFFFMLMELAPMFLR